MKTAKKTLILALAVLMMMGATMLGTLAYLTSRSSVTNTFTVGKVGITVNEAIVDPDGTPTGGRHVGNHYRLVPGQKYTKDPTMTVHAYSEDSYVRMIVTINKIDLVKKLLGDDFLPEEYVDGWDPAVWKCVSIGGGTKKDASNNDIAYATYEFRYINAETKNIVKRSTENQTLPALFTHFELPGSFDVNNIREEGEDDNALNEKLKGMTIEVEGHAIQAGTFADEDAAWAAFKTQYDAQNP